MTTFHSPEAALLQDLQICGHLKPFFSDLNEILIRVVRSARSGTIRDLDFNSVDFAQGIRGLYTSTYGLEPKYTRKQRGQIRIFLRIVLRLPEFKESKTTPRFIFDSNVVEIILNRLVGTTTFPSLDVADVEVHESEDRATRVTYQEDEFDFCSEMLYMTYLYQRPKDRCLLRTSMSLIVQRTASKPSRNNAKATHAILQVIICAIRGFNAPYTHSHTDLLRHVILPLHDVEGKISHTVPLLSVFYQSMMECCVEYVQMNVLKYTEIIIRQVLKSWPPQSAGNSPKEILMVQEITTILETMMTAVEENNEDQKKNIEKNEGKNSSSSSSSSSPRLPLEKPERVLLFRRIASCLASDNSLVCQATLKMWSEPLVFQYFKQYALELLKSITVPLLTQSCNHWNQTVQKMSGLVLQKSLSNTSIEILNQTLCQKTSMEQLQLLVFKLLGTDNNNNNNNNNNDNDVDEEIGGKHSTTATASNETRDTNISTSTSRTLEELTMFDVVFGKVLGIGSFGTVKQAYKIVRGKSRSEWPQYAIKQINKIHMELVKREEKVMLDVLLQQGGAPHPGLIQIVAPLFESRSSVHLAMEYVKGGDLHSQIIYGTKRYVEKRV